jgi:hypothetical protein
VAAPNLGEKEMTPDTPQTPATPADAKRRPNSQAIAYGMVILGAALVEAFALGALIGISCSPRTPDTPKTPVTPADGKKRPNSQAIAYSIGILAVALVGSVALGAIVVNPVVPISIPANQGFGLFAAFYVAAQIVERITEPFTWVLDQFQMTDDANKSNRTALIHSVAVLIAVIITGALGLHFLQAVGIGDSNHHLPGWIDIYATALVISGGTKPLHDFISLLQQKKDQASGSA